MYRRITPFVTAVALVALLSVPSWAWGDNKTSKTRLTGYQETPQAISTTGKGAFRAKISNNKKSIAFTLRYRDLEGGTPPGTPTAAHIHLGQPGVSGCVVIHLCGTGGKPACPASPGTVTGTITETDVVACEPGGIAAGELGEVIAALRAHTTYVNVHNTTYPSGEIRGAIKHGKN